MASVNIETMTISQLFDKAWSIYDELDKRDDRNESDYIRKLREAIQYLEKCDLMIEEIHLFTDNESIDEISTKELRYFLYPALLASLLSKINYNLKERLNNLFKIAHFYLKFLKLTKDYELHNFSIPSMASVLNSNEQNSTNENSAKKDLDKDLLKSAFDRNEKIKRFKEQKEIEKQLEAMKITCKNDHVDDEQKRLYYITCIKFWLNKSIEEVKFVFDEIKLLKSREGLTNDQIEEEKNKPKPAPIKPYVLTRDALQAQVFGAGYPSLPVYSVEEFFDQLVDRGCMQPSDGDNNLPVKIGGGVTDKQKEDDKKEKDKLEDAHDDDNLKQQREWDDWKDDNKRGSGNRYNRS